MSEDKPVSEYVATLALVVAVCEKPLPVVVLRSTLKPSSLLELSVQERLIWLEEIVLALKFDGAEGMTRICTVVVISVALANGSKNKKNKEKNP